MLKSYIQDLKYALKNGAKIDFQARRLVDEKRDEKYTNQYTVNKLFPDENPLDAIKRELLTLSVENYIQTVKDLEDDSVLGQSFQCDGCVGITAGASTPNNIIEEVQKHVRIKF